MPIKNAFCTLSQAYLFALTPLLFIAYANTHIRQRNQLGILHFSNSLPSARITAAEPTAQYSQKVRVHAEYDYNYDHKRHDKLSSPWMMLCDQILQALLRHVRINLGRGQVTMAQHHLYRAQVGPIIHQMSGKGMAKRVRRN